METSNENRNSLCIFCLKSTDDCTGNRNTTSQSYRHKFFTSIVRHFSNSALISTDNQEWFRNACELAVNGNDNDLFSENVQICNNCEGITRKFTDLYYQMKEFKLRIDWEVGKLRDVMGCADKSASKLEKDKLEKTNGGGGVTLGEFRNSLKQSFRDYLEFKKKMTVPMIEEESPLNGSEDTVDLQSNSDCFPDLFSPISLEDFRIASQEVLEYPTDPKFQGHSSQPEVDIKNEFLAEEVVVKNDEKQTMDVKLLFYPDMVVNCEYDLPSLPTPAPDPTLQEEDPLNPSNKSQSIYICTTLTCSLPFTSKFELFQHNMANHIGKYFSSVQHSEIPNDHFNLYITQLLETTLDSFDKVDEKYTCHLCSNPFPGREKARNHLVVKHRVMLKEQLVKLQKSESDLPQPSQIIEHSISTSTTDDTSNKSVKRKRGWTKGKNRKSKSDFKCSHCSLSLPNRKKIFNHDMHNHPENFFVSVKLKFLTPHQFQNCVAHMLTTSLDEFQRVDSKYQCSFCNRLLSARPNARHHLIVKHRSVLMEKLVEIQNSSNINMIMNTSRRTNHGTSLSARKNKICHHICNICKHEFKMGSYLNSHQMYCHFEMFFESSNLLPSSSENNEQFKTCVRYILEQQMEAPVPKDGDQVKCGICCNVSSNHFFARRHLVLRHRVFLAEKLEELQKSGNESIWVSNSSSSGAPPLKRIKTNYDPHSVCNTCKKVYKGNTVLIRHQTVQHPEIFFEAENPTELQMDSEGNQLFRKYVRFVLERQVDQEFFEVVTGETLPETDPLKELEVSTLGVGDNIKYQCNLCSKAFCIRNNAITHLILRHRRNIADMLAGLNGKSVEEIKMEIMPSEAESQEYDSLKPTSSLDSLEACATPTTLKRKGGWPKGKSRSLKNPSLDCNVESGNASPKKDESTSINIWPTES